MTDHTVASFDEELNEMRSKVVQMANIVNTQLQNSLTALQDRNSELAEKVRLTDQLLDDLDSDVERSAVEFIARRAPVAVDLREIIAIIRISNTLERIGDYAKNFAKRLDVLLETDSIRSSERLLSHMVDITSKMVTDVIDAYIRRDIDLALEIWHRDQEIDAIYNTMFRELLTYMMEHPHYITTATHMLFIAKNIERAGDHATNIAEMAYYIATGKALDMERPKKDKSHLAAAPDVEE
ncbi:MAG: phosphate transport system regulatory protein PhoU [Kordiimonas sp.]|nr:phosphate transport system regulatory protein PhoU [Kordiimonas sp.]